MRTDEWFEGYCVCTDPDLPSRSMQETMSSTPTALLLTVARLCPARWLWSTTSLSNQEKSKCGSFFSTHPCQSGKLLCAFNNIAFFFRWFCHVDDDNYMNVKTLVKLLSLYPHTQDLYIGKPSLDRPIEATERLGDNKMVSS